MRSRSRRWFAVLGTMALLAGLVVAATPAGAEPSTPVLNEYVANHTGTDTNEYIEVFGTPETDYSAYTVLEIEGDGGGAGVIDAAFTVGTTNADGTWFTGFLNDDIENGSVTFLLVEGFTGSVGDDLDTDNDGVFDVTPWTTLVDDVAVDDGGSSDRHYSTTVLAAFYDGNNFAPGGASRLPNGFDTDTTDDWTRNDFNGWGLPGFTGSAGIGIAANTPDALNELTPVDPFGACFDREETRIHAIQGDGYVSPDLGAIRTVEAVVIGDFQGSTELRGIFLQEEKADTDNDKATSEGIFVYFPIWDGDVEVGDLVRLRGVVDEYFDLTELTDVDTYEVCGDGYSVRAEQLTLPRPPEADYEPVEGMLVTFPQTLVASDNFSWGRFGEVGLSVNHALENPTNAVPPGIPANNLNDLNDRSRVLLDDGSGVQNPEPPAYLGEGGTLRVGDTVRNLTGAMDYAFGSYRIQPTADVTFERVNDRPTSAPDVGGSLTVAAFNVLNYFTTLDNAGPICGPDLDQDCRGADNAFEFGRQKAKLVSAITQMDADVVGVIEIENAPNDVPINDLVSGLNDVVGPGTYAAIQTGAIGTDAIRVGFIYQPGAVTPVGDYAVLDSTVDPTFDDEKNRPVLAQTFEDGSGERFTVAVNHLKSKGSPCDDVGDPDTGDQQGNCNATRTAAAIALANWLATDPTGSGDPDVLIIGDLNSYAKEDPISALVGAGYTDLVRRYVGPDAYSYVFFGETGYLDHALANRAMRRQVTGTAVWGINAAEPSALDYNNYNQPSLYTDGPWRSSDHDPVIVGLDLRSRR